MKDLYNVSKAFRGRFTESLLIRHQFITLFKFFDQYEY